MKWMTRWLPIVLVLAAGAQDGPERTYRQGTLTVIFHLTELELRVGTRLRKIDITKLPIHAGDCDDDEEREKCVARKEDPCRACVGIPDMVAWDEAHRVLYFGIPNGSARNNGWVLVAYSVEPGVVKRVVASNGAGTGLGTVSPSGRYLAYASFQHCGACCNASVIEVVDLQLRRIGAVEMEGNGDDVIQVGRLRWVTGSELEYEAEVHSESECTASTDFRTRNVKRRVRVSGIEFR